VRLGSLAGLLCFAAFPRPGTDVEGVVTSVTRTHCVVRGADWSGTVHFTEMSWARVEKAADVCSADQRLKARVVRVKGDRVILSVKATLPDPWTTVPTQYPKDRTVKGVVSWLGDDSVDFELEPGIEGRAKEDDIPPSARRLHIGDEVELEVLGADVAKRRVQLRVRAPQRRGPRRRQPAR
jgi:small subunit ribosomal protein S1